MKLSLVFNALASIVALATAYPTQGPAAKRSSNVEKRKEFNSDLFNYNSEDYLQKKRSDLIGDVSKPESLEEGKREEQVYAYIEKNQRGSVWAEHKTEMQSLAVKSSRRISSRTIDEWDQLVGARSGDRIPRPFDVED
ncbi:hypothetical protein P692DRAFT_201853218 [Suillus brevipes Sb2]|nr:hypothetical protein P692DRAFT_201853218 [Suillus brevipes Sb2]